MHGHISIFVTSPELHILWFAPPLDFSYATPMGGASLAPSASCFVLSIILRYFVFLAVIRLLSMWLHGYCLMDSYNNNRKFADVHCSRTLS